MNLIKKARFRKRSNLLVIGAGEAGELIGRHILENSDLGYNIIAFLDDDPAKINTVKLGIPVHGPASRIKSVCSEKAIDEIVLAMPSVRGEMIRKIFYELRDSDVEIKILPSSFEDLRMLERGVAGYSDVRPLKIEDFFRRKPVIYDLNKIKGFFENKSILVTGAAGSIGSELCKQLLTLNPGKLIALDQAETPLHDLILSIKQDQAHRFVPLLANIRDKEKLRKTMSEYKPHIVFHAAAYKHVPMMEVCPDEAIKNNIFGTRNVISASEEADVKNFVLISTDKAVNPTSIMGASKRLTEMMIQEKRDSQTNFIAVRFGNVINSQGSVVPLFRNQIDLGGPITVTHKDIERFFMTIPEAVQLIIQVPIFGENGNIFVLDMGQQVKILKIAEEMIELAGFKPHKDIEIKFTGLRPGEKINEELSTVHETMSKTPNERISLINTSQLDAQKFKEDLAKLEYLAEQSDAAGVVDLIKKSVPNFNDQNGKTREIPSV